MATTAPLLEKARADYEAHRWALAVLAFEQVGGFARLGPEDAERFAWSLMWTGRTAAECLDAFEQLERVSRAAGDRRGAARAALEQARMHALLGSDVVAAACWARALEHLDGDHETVEYGMAYALAGYARLLEGDSAGALDLVATARAVRDRLGDVTVEAFCEYVAGQAAVLDGDVGDGVAMLDHAISLALTSEVQLLCAGIIHCGVLWACRQIGDWPRAREWHEVATRWCEREAVVHFPAHLDVHRAELARVGGRFEEAHQAALDALDRAGDWSRDLLAWAHHQVGECRLSFGDLPGAETALARAEDMSYEPQPGRSRLLLALGRPEAALRNITHAIENPNWYALSSRLHTLPAGVSIALTLGRTEIAVRWFDELAALADRYRTSPARAAADQAAGEVALARDEAGEARDRLEAAVRKWRSSRAPADAERSRVLLARAHAANGHFEDARAELERARRAFVHLGAKWEAKRTARMLFGIEGPLSDGVTRRTPDAEAFDGLTPRQRDVAALVAKGYTNQQIADELVVSRNTAETHVKHILTRLGFSSRAEIAAWANEKGLAPRSWPGPVSDPDTQVR